MTDTLLRHVKNISEVPMSKTPVRKKYSEEFKKDAVDLVKTAGYNRAEATRRLGISPSILGRWVREAESDDRARETGQPTEKELKAEIQHLKAENKRLEMEREILKKAAAFFAKESK